MSLSQTTKKTQRIYFGYYAYIAGPMGEIFRYLLRSDKHTKDAGRKMALRAISAFWKPFSARSLSNLDEDKVRMIARDSIDELRSQIKLIERTFNIEQNHLSTVTRPEVEQMIEAKLEQQGIGSRRIFNKPIPVPDNYQERNI